MKALSFPFHFPLLNSTKFTISAMVPRIGVGSLNPQLDASTSIMMGSQLIQEAEDTEISTTLFPISLGGTARNDSLYMQGMQEGSRMLFTIKEETKEDMEWEEFDSKQRMGKPQRPSPPTNKNNKWERCYHQLQK